MSNIFLNPFLKSFEIELSNSKHQESYYISDLNIDFLKTSNTLYELNTLINNYGYEQIIKTPTRSCETSETLIDLIITNGSKLCVKSGVLSCSISDHDIVYTLRKLKAKCNRRNVTKEIRSFKNVDWKSFKKSLASAPWWCLTLIPEINVSYAAFRLSQS